MIAVLTCLVSLASLYSEDIKWVTDLKKGLGEAKASGKPVMIDVYTDWCYWCKELDAKTYKDPKVVSLSKSFVNIKVNPEKDRVVADFIKNYEINGYPTILFVEHTGDLLLKVGGFLGGPEFLKKMQEVGTIRDKLVRFEAEYGKGDLTNTVDYIALLVEAMRLDKAASVFDKVKSDKKVAGERLGDFYLQIGLYYMKKEDIKRALPYFADAEKKYPDTRTGLGATYYHAYCEYLLGNNDKAVSIIAKVVKNPNLPAEWKAQFESAQKSFALKK